MTLPIISREALPDLYQSASKASRRAQSLYFSSLQIYLFLLVLAAIIAFLWPNSTLGAVASASLFLVTLAILIGLRMSRPDALWYNARAVTESVKTIAWRWMMRADPYTGTSLETVRQRFTDDLKEILHQNQKLTQYLRPQQQVKAPISTEMERVRELNVLERIELYKAQRINAQSNWYVQKAEHNHRQAQQWFWLSVMLHVVAIILLLYRIPNPTRSLPIEVISTAASAVLTWLQSKKFNELSSSYALAAHEISFIKGEALSVKSESDLAALVISSEAAFSREHTQWIARKNE